MKIENRIITLFVASGLALGLAGCGPSYEAVKPSITQVPKTAKGTNYITLAKQKSYLSSYLNTGVGIIDAKTDKFTSYGNVVAYINAQKKISFLLVDKKRENNMFGFQDILNKEISIEDISLNSFLTGDDVFDLSSLNGLAYINDKREIAISTLDLTSLGFAKNINSEYAPPHIVKRIITKSDVKKIAFVPNRRQLVVLTANKKLTLWDLKNKKPKKIKTLVSGKSTITNIEFSKSGNYLGYSDEKRLYIYSMKKGKQVVSFDQQGISAIAFSTDEQYLASTGSSSDVVVYDLKNKKTSQSFKHKHLGAVHGLAFENESNEVLVTAGEDGKIQSWFLKNTSNPSSKKYYAKQNKRICDAKVLMKKFLSASTKEYNSFLDKYSPKYTSCNILGDKEQVIEFSNKGILDKYIETLNGVVLAKYPKVEQEYERIAYAQLQELEHEAAKHYLKLSDAEKKKKLNEYYNKFINNNKAFVYALNAGSYYGLIKFNNEFVGFGTGSKEVAHFHQLGGKQIALGDPYQTKAYFKYNPNNSIQIYAISKKIEFFAGRGRYDEVLSYNSNIIAAKDNKVEIWNYVDYSIEDVILENGQIYSLAYDKKHNYLAIGSSSKVIKIWDLNKKQLVQELTGHTENILSLQFTHNGKNLLSASVDKTVKVWNVQTGKNIKTLKGFERAASRIKIAPDGKTFLVVSVGDSNSKIKIYDNETYALLNTISPEIGTIAGIEYTKKDNRIIALSSGQSFQQNKGHIIISIDTANYKELKRSYFQPGFRFSKGMVIDEELGLIVVAGSGRYLSVLDLNTFEFIGELDNGPIKYGSNTIDAIGKTKNNEIITGNRMGNLNILYNK